MPFSQTDAGQAFIASAASRETSAEIMQAIAFFARDAREAEMLWNGDGFGQICHLSDIWERVTGNGQRDAADYCWGALGSRWYATPALSDAAQAVVDTVRDGIRDNARVNQVPVTEHWTADAAIETYAEDAFTALSDDEKTAVKDRLSVWLRAGEHDAP